MKPILKICPFYTTIRNLLRILFPMIDSGVLVTGEYNCITSELRRLAVHGEQKPEVLVKLISRKEVCELLGIKLRAIKSGKFSFHKRLCVCSARYLLSETLAYIEALPIEGNSENTSE